MTYDKTNLDDNDESERITLDEVITLFEASATQREDDIQPESSASAGRGMNPCLLHKGSPPPATELNRSIKYPLPPTRHDTASHTECVAIRLGAGYTCKSFDGLNSVAGGGNPYSSISQGGRR